jgi:hypothetical protein
MLFSVRRRIATLYNRFVPVGIVFCLILAGFSMPSASAFGANFYTVEGIKVDITAENALSARNQAFEKAQAEAFASLSSRMVSAAGTPLQQTVPDIATISTMIQDYEITEEKLSSVRYIATYTFRFRARAVERYFGSGARYAEPQVASAGTPASTPVPADGGTPAEAVPGASTTTTKPLPSRSVLVLPFYEYGGRTLLWSPENSWLQAWNRAPGLDGAVPLVVPLGDLADVRDIGDDRALTYDAGALAGMVKRYNAVDAAVLVAEPYAGFPPQGAPGDMAKGALRVHLYRTDRPQPEYAGQIEVIARPGQSRMSLFNEAVQKVSAVLQNQNWKQGVAPGVPGGGQILVHMSVSGLREWTETQRALERMAGVEAVILKSLSPRDAYVEIRFKGPENRLGSLLAQAGLRLEPPPVGTGGASVYKTAYELRHNRDIPDSYTNRF